MTKVPTMAMMGAAIQAHSTRPIVWKMSQLSGTSATKIGGQAEDDEAGAGHFDAGRLAERVAGGVGRGAEIVPGADAARVFRRPIFAA